MQEDTFTGTLMSGDVPIATIEQDRLVPPVREELLPLYLRRTENFRHWLSTRAIDRHRTNARLLKKALRLTGYSDEAVALSVNAATITDTYWVREKGDSRTYDDIRFSVNYFDKVAFLGSPQDMLAAAEIVHTQGRDSRAARTPELTNIGSYEKCWRLEDGIWWLYKRGNANEQFSELFVYELGKALGFPMAEYHKTEHGVKSPDFTAGAAVNFEPAQALMNDNEDYIDNYKTFKALGDTFADEYLQIIFLDVLCVNADRHTANYGVLRDPATGALLSMAPNFDNNIALISGGYPQSAVRKGDMLLRSLRELEEQCGAVSDYATRHALPVITQELVRECILRTGMEVDEDFICTYLVTGYECSVLHTLNVMQEQDTAQEMQL